MTRDWITSMKQRAPPRVANHNQPEILVHADLRPDADVAVHGPRLVLPRLVAEFAGPWNCV